MDDQQIIRLFNERSEEAIAATKEKYGNILGKIARNVLGNSDDAEECVNDAYLALWNSIPPQSPDPLGAYACKVAKNISLKKFRHNSAEKRNTYYDASFDELADCLISNDSVDDGVNEKELKEAIDRFLGKIKKVDRILFVKRYWFAQEISQIAEETGYGANYINVHLHRTREKLKAFLIKENLYE
ncbi:MAG: sigma-70 family RNA polymerase sigma factor [Clostridiales bacterium]|nr:sigma-70 family RNA polymerase sigma factor [Clostridiales bacterium]